MKKVIYYSSTSFFYAIYAAAVRSGHLPGHQAPSWRQWQTLLQDNNLTPQQGVIYNLGYDNRGVEILALWSRGHNDMVQRLMVSFSGLFNQNNFQLISITAPEQFCLKVGAKLIKVRLLSRWGYRLLQRGLLKIMPRLTKYICWRIM